MTLKFCNCLVRSLRYLPKVRGGAHAVGQTCTIGRKNSNDIVIDNGAIQEKQASNVLKNVLTRAVGVSPQLEVDIISGPVQPGDIFLLCSDGLYNMVADNEIEEVLAFDAPLTLKAEMLVNMANDNGGRDNISVTLVQIPTP